MQMLGEQQVAASCQKVWEGLNDPEVLRASIPGCQSLTKEADDRFAATVEVKVGPIGARFKGVVTLTELNPPHSYVLLLEGNGGIAGTAKGAAKVRLSEANGGTLVSYEVDAQVGGRMAQLGGPIIDATAKQLAGKFFSRLNEVLTGATVTDASGATGAVITASASTPSAPTAPAAAQTPVYAATHPGATLWPGIAIGLLLILVAAMAFEYGRNSAAPVIMLDNAVLERLLQERQQPAATPAGDRP